MKRVFWISGLALLLTAAAAGAYFAAEASAPPQISSLMPEGALLYIEAKDFHSLLGDWQSSAQKRSWLTSDDYQDFSRSHLFSRLSQAQDEFAAAAGIPTGIDLLDKVAGSQSALALYDIGNLEFVYVTCLSQQDAEKTPLWQSRGKFEERSEAGYPFFVRQDIQSQRVAAFAFKDGWLILGTREDLVAGVLDRLQSPGTHQFATEAWFAEAVRRASASHGDLRMVLNLDKILPSPYFRSYWIQRNISEMKQYTAAISDLYRTPSVYREERVLLRRAGTASAANGDIAAVAALVPDNIGFWSAQASPDPDDLLDHLRRNLLELKPSTVEGESAAPPEAVAHAVGSASDLDVRIDQAPATEQEADAWQPLRALLQTAQPTAILELGSTAPVRDNVFLPIQTAAVITAAHAWNEQQVTDALATALAPGLTASHLGLAWQKRSSAAGDYLALNGQVSLCVAVRDTQLLLASDPALLESMLGRRASAATASGVTYSAVFHHAAERDSFIALTSQLDRIGNRGRPDGQTAGSDGDAPAFFSGNIASLSRVLAQVAEESIEEKDLGDHVTQTVTYQWQQ
ncbi:MAG TPA: hypothetical protein VMD92_06440 [Acidobacteriaceae bacterium]|nr:hypothetical protein [Acidobacteriaceae bacterium]